MASVAPIGKPHRTASNGHDKQTPITLGHLPDSLPVERQWRDRIRSWLYRLERQWEPVVVNKQIDSVTMPKWIAIGILGSVLAFGAQSWWKASDQRDMLIELRTEIRMAKEYEAERSKQLKEQAEINKVYIDNMTSQLNVIKGMLSAQQMSAVDAAKRGSN
jgi:hypothetical protein